MDQDFETPPMGAENLPIKELKPQKEVLEPMEPKKFFLVIVIFLAVFLGLIIGLKLKKSNDKTPLPSPLSVVPSPAGFVLASPIPQNLEEKINSFKKKLDEVDLKESELSLPVLDYDLRFEVKD